MKVEPRADTRMVCVELFALYVGLVDAGFSDLQALRIVSTVVQSMVLAAGDE